MDHPEAEGSHVCRKTLQRRSRREGGGGDGIVEQEEGKEEEEEEEKMGGGGIKPQCRRTKRGGVLINVAILGGKCGKFMEILSFSTLYSTIWDYELYL